MIKGLFLSFLLLNSVVGSSIAKLRSFSHPGGFGMKVAP